MFQVLELVPALVLALESAGTRTGRDASRNRGEGRACRVLKKNVCSEEGGCPSIYDTMDLNSLESRRLRLIDRRLYMA
jgi:hypothetical protein